MNRRLLWVHFVAAAALLFYLAAIGESQNTSPPSALSPVPFRSSDGRQREANGGLETGARYWRHCHSTILPFAALNGSGGTTDAPGQSCGLRLMPLSAAWIAFSGGSLR